MKIITITVEMKSAYGRLLCYPRSPYAEVFAELAGTKTLTRHALSCIDRLGISIYSLNGDPLDWERTDLE